MGPRILHKTICILFSCLLMITTVFSNAMSIYAIQDEKTIKVGYYIAPGFQEYDEATKTYSGSGYEYLMALEQYTNWRYEFVPVDFAQGVKMLENGELDLMNNISKTSDREATLSFSTYPSGQNHGCLVVAKDNQSYAYNDYAAMNNMRVGITKTSIFKSSFDTFCSQHNIRVEYFYYENETQMSAAKNNGEIDGQLVSSSYNDGSRVIAKFAPMEYYFAVNKDNQETLLELNEAMEQIQIDLPNLQKELADKAYQQYSEQSVILSQDEKNYLKTNNKVNVAIDASWSPLAYFLEGQFGGPLADIYYEVGKRTGIEFNFQSYKNQSSALAAVKSGKADMLGYMPYDFTYANDNEIYLTNAIKEISFYRVTDEKYFDGDLTRIALYDNDYENQLIKACYGSDTIYKTYKNQDEAIDAVLNNKADCTFVNQYQTATYQNRGKYISLQFVSLSSIKYNFALGLSKDSNPLLSSIVSKGLRTINSEYLNYLFEMATETNELPDLEAQFYQNPPMFITIICIIGALVVFGISLMVFYHKMKRKNKELEKAKMAQSDFLSRMSHDMRTPMNGILGLATLIQDKDDLELIHQDVEQIQYAGQYLLNLINDTLDMNKIESGKLELHLQPVDSGQLAKNILTNVRLLADDKDVILNVTLPEIPEGQWKYVITDASRVEQILVNLISNAIKYTPAKGTVNIVMKNLAITENEIVDQYIISDTGIGMSQDFLPHVFDPFSMEGRANFNREQGTGLGMAIVKQLVTLLDGKIDIQSEVDVGTTVTLELHYQRYHGAIKQEIPEQLDFASLQGKHVLMVEDNLLNAQIMEGLLNKVGITCTHAINGQVGYNTFRNSKEGEYDGILMDIRMPIMDGLEATRQIRGINTDYALKTPIIAMTANAFDQDVQNCLEAGMNAHLSKPINPQKLYATLIKYLNHI